VPEHGYPYKKKRGLKLSLHDKRKNNLKWIIDLKVKSKMTVLFKNIGDNICNLTAGKDFLERIKQVQTPTFLNQYTGLKLRFLVHLLGKLLLHF